ncbi:hypothetical protein [Halorubrum distributum]|uniref:hypothetical protein n=1 Tax=Halorubrum distributum TaxID=29283 RepID=UPI001268D123|nr:hypothetical protein [Halorubrum arcis]
MSAISQPVGFELDDILTRVIPGAVLVFSVSIAIYELNLLVDIIEYSPYSTKFIAFGIILSFIFGELIELFRYQVFPTPKSFNRLVYRSSKNIDHLYLLDQILIYFINIFPQQEAESERTTSSIINFLFHIPWMDDYQYSIEREYENNIITELADSNPLPGDKYRPNHLYYFLLKRVEPSLGKNAKRRLVLSRFYINFKISLIPTFSFLSYIGYIRYANESIYTYLVVVFLLGAIIYIYGSVIIKMIFGSVQMTHISDLLREYIYQGSMSKAD